MNWAIVALLFSLTTLLAPVAPVFAQSSIIGDPKVGQPTQPSQGDSSGSSSTTNYPSGCEPGADSIKLGVPILGISELPRGEGAFRCYVLIFYKYIIGVAVVLAAIMCSWAGYIYLTSGGDPSRQTHARELIIGALSGLALLLLASTVLRLLGTGSGSGTNTGGLEVSPEQRQEIPRLQ